ncbi:MAG TPA: PhoPQ-activated pathogenicity-related family protein [Pirellulales bacterium]|jgi:PhoPQ-activated pathogenicity-related protein|nr:PhoPQ-activated pathogenicity-related family protein [Pirellulales bacterium]
MLRRPARLALLVLVLSCPLVVAADPGQDRTALDDYVAKPDPSYSYQLVRTIPGQGLTTYVIEMISQTWLTTAEVNQPVWKHWVILTKPDKLKTNKALLYISGGANGGEAPDKVDPMMTEIAKATGSVTTELKMVPNQPLVFAGETIGRKEDSLIAYTWDKFLRTGDPKWPARLPMTKAAVRALDTITDFCASEAGGKAKVDEFVVCGGSKRGWTTWTTAAVDRRVIAIVPFVIDLLNIEPSFIHHWEAYGFWAPSVGDYVQMKLMEWNGTPEYKALMKIEEPFQYRSRLTMPKFIVNATGDQFFLPDSSQFYFNELPGPKYLRYVPNADHSLGGTDAPFTLLAYYGAVINKTKLPEYTWSVGKDDSLQVHTYDKPSAVKLWSATNAESRDFRVENIGRVWKSESLSPQGDGDYVGKVEKPAKGYTAFMVELTYPNGAAPPLKFTTQVKVLPDVLPFKYEPPKVPR